MTTREIFLPASNRGLAAFLLPAFLVLATGLASAAPEQSTTNAATATNTTSTATNTTSTGNTATGNTQGTARTTTGAARTDTRTQNTPTQTQSTPVIRNENLAPPGNQGRMSNQTRPTADTRAAEENRRRGDADDTGLTADQQRAVQQNLGFMDARLDQLLAAMNTATGANRTEAMAVVIQELVVQLAEMRRLLLGTDFTSDPTGLGTLGDQEALFITPSSAAQAEGRRRGELNDGIGPTTAPTNRGGLEATPPVTSGVTTSGLASQAESRRRGDLGSGDSAGTSDGSTATSSLTEQAAGRRAGELPDDTAP